MRYIGNWGYRSYFSGTGSQATINCYNNAMQYSLLLRPASSMMDQPSADHDSAFSGWCWLTLDRQGLPVGEMQCGSEPPASDSAIILIPVNWMHLRTVNLPRMRNAQLQQALPFAFEEHIAGDIERMHVAAGNASAGGGLPAAAIESELLSNLLAQLQEHTIHAARAVPDALCIPVPPMGQVTLLSIGEDVLVRAFDSEVFCLRNDELEWYLQSLEGLTHAHLLVPSRDSTLSAATVQQAVPDIIVTSEEIHSGLHSLRIGNPGVDIDLLSGRFSPGQRNQQQVGWRKLALAAGIFLMVLTAYATTDWWLLKAAKADAQQAVNTVFRSKFPAITTIVNPRVQAERAIGGSNSADGKVALQLLAVVAPAVSRNTELQLLSLDYERGSLRLQMRGDSVAQLEELIQDLQSQQVNAELQGVNRDAEQVRGEVVVEARR